MAFCRSCGTEVNANAVACTGCGVTPSNGNSFCQECGTQTNPKAIVCVDCGVNLTSAASSGGSSAGAFIPNPNPVGIGEAILWFLCCLPIGYMKWNQSTKGWAWLGINFITGGIAVIPWWIDYWMCYTAQQKRTLGEWEWFPTA